MLAAARREIKFPLDFDAADRAPCPQQYQWSDLREEAKNGSAYGSRARLVVCGARAAGRSARGDGGRIAGRTDPGSRLVSRLSRGGVMRIVRLAALAWFALA